MFTWICPQCGREVPPSNSECPTCAERRKAAGAPPPQPPPPQYAPPPPQQYAPPPPQYVPPQPQYVPPQPQYIPPQPQYVPPQPQYAPQEPQFVPPQLPPLPAQAQYTISEERRGMPGWMVALMAAALLGGLLYVAYKYLLPGHNTATASQTAGAEKAVVPGSTSSHPYAKFLEVSALRLAEEKGKPKLMYTVVNHSGGELAGVELKITLRPTTAKPEDAPIATFVSKVGSLGPYEAKDMSTIIETKERAYELPDWQFLHADFDVTAPK